MGEFELGGDGRGCGPKGRSRCFPAEPMAVEIKHGLAPRLEKGFHFARGPEAGAGRSLFTPGRNAAILADEAS